MAIRCISSMATKLLLAEIASIYEKDGGERVILESVGGVEAARRIEAGEDFDLVFLASDAIARLTSSGRLVKGSDVDLVRSGVAVAVKTGAPLPDISTGAALKEAVRKARSVGYSTGPSGVALAKLFESWGFTEIVKDKLVVPPPGVPVGSLIARGEVELGFQQLSELLHVEGISIVGPLPPETAIITVFSAGVVAASRASPEAGAFLNFFRKNPTAAEAVRRQGMEPV